MINVYLTTEAGELQVWKSGVDADVVERIVPRSWIYLAEPNEDEILAVARSTKIAESILRKALDEEESAHIDEEGDVSIVVADTPIFTADPERPHISRYYTTPMSILFDKDYFVVACAKKNFVIPAFLAKTMKNFSTAKHYKLTIQLLYRNASMFVTLLKQLDKESEGVQARLQEALKNSELFDLMNLNKSLVYLATGLSADLNVLERLKNSEAFRQFPDDVALIDDAMIENRQAIEMSSIHREILNGTLDTYASVISNNVNAVMKTLTVVTIVLTVPMLIASFFGMNFTLPIHVDSGFWFAFILSIALSLLLGMFLARYSSRLNYHWGGGTGKKRNRPRKTRHNR
ncbi:MAG: magnesium transporter CorA family protein [Candidatus Izemoplasmatales bacterium]